MLIETSLVSNPSLCRKLSYDPFRDFSPINGLVVDAGAVRARRILDRMMSAGGHMARTTTLPELRSARTRVSHRVRHRISPDTETDHERAFN